MHGRALKVVIDGHGAVFSGAKGVRYLSTFGIKRTNLFEIHLSNMTLKNFGSPSMSGGALMLSGADGVYLHNIRFVNNTGSYGGAVYISSNYSNPYSEAVLNIDNCTFGGNRAAYGGAIYAVHGTITTDGYPHENSNYSAPLLGSITSSKFGGNVASSHGGAVVFEGLAPGSSLLKNIFVSNAAGISGSAVAMTGSRGVIVDSNAFYSNHANYSAAVYWVAHSGMDDPIGLTSKNIFPQKSKGATNFNTAGVFYPDFATEFNYIDVRGFAGHSNVTITNLPKNVHCNLP